MSVLAAAIPVVGNLLGGLFGNRSAKKAAAQQRAWALEDQAQQWVRHRSASEAGGFNPLATLGLGQGVATTAAASGNYMGEAIAQSSLLLADSLGKTKQKAASQTEALRMQNTDLQRKLTKATLRPNVPGVYQRAQAFGTGGGNANVSAVSGGVSANAAGNADAVEPVTRNVAELVGSHGQTTRVPTGPDIDEIVPGVFIDLWNQYKSNRTPYGWEMPSGRRAKPQTNGGIARVIPNLSVARPRMGGEFDPKILAEFNTWVDPRVIKPKVRQRFNPNHRDGYYYP